MSASLSLFDKEHTAREKYVYFICGVSSALIAYIGKDYTPKNPWTTHDTLTLCTLGCLIFSLVFGLLRILFYIQGMSFNRDVLVAEEETAIISQSLTYPLAHLDKGIPISIGSKTVKYYKKEDLENRRKTLIELADKKRPKMEWWHNWSTGFLWVCNILLIAGFILLALSKLPDTAIATIMNRMCLSLFCSQPLTTIKLIGIFGMVIGLMFGFIERIKSPPHLILAPEPKYLKYISWGGWILTAIAGFILIFV